jgi:signal peptidase I
VPVSALHYVWRIHIRTVAVYTIVFCILATGCSFAQHIATIKAEGTAMSPTIKDGDTIRIDRRAYSNDSGINRFDIVVFSLSEDQKKFVGRVGEVLYIKRVVGLPGEVLEIRAGKTFVNGQLLDEPFIDYVWKEDEFGPVTIPNGEYFVLGDNRANSFDSRYIQPATVKLSDVTGKIIEVAPAKK